MPGRNTLGQTLVVAALVHAGFLVLAGHIHAPVRPPPSEVGALDLLAIDVAPDVPIPPPDVPPDPSERATEPTAALDTTVPRSRVPRQPETAAVSSAVVLPESGSPPAGAWTLRVTTDGHPGAAGEEPALARLGLAGQNRFMGRRETPEEEARAAREQANAAAGEAMRQSLHDRDVSLGLGGGGPVLTALEAAVRDGPGADESRAVLVAVADASGRVLRVDVESATDEAAYRTIAEDVLARLRGQHLRVPAGANGLAMRVNVDSRLAAPSGGGLGLDPKGTAAHFDIADLGARRRRVIHARVLAEQVL